MIASEPPPIPCVGAVIHNTRGCLLLVLRAHDPGRGQWSLPGGRVESGESDQAAVVREVREETGLSVTVDRLIGRVSRPGTQGTYEIADYLCRIVDERLCPGDDAADAAWTDRATFTTLEQEGALTEGLAGTLRAWGCLPRDEDAIP